MELMKDIMAIIGTIFVVAVMAAGTYYAWACHEIDECMRGK